MHTITHHVVAVLLALGPSDPTGPAAPETVRIDSVWDFVLKGGPVMIPIGVASLFALAIFVERAWSLRRKRVLPSQLAADLRALLADSPREPTRLVECCKRHASPLANVLAAGLGNLGQPIDLIERRITEAGEREVFGLRKYMRGLALIGSIATLLGLLGTITGMISAFQTVATSGEALGKTELLAKGIYEAMITTAAGLLVAIPTMLGYHYLSGKIDYLVHEMDRHCVEVVESCGKAVPQAARASGRETISVTERPPTDSGDGRLQVSSALPMAVASA